MARDDAPRRDHRPRRRARRRAPCPRLGDRRRRCWPRSRPPAGRWSTAATMYDLERAAPPDVDEGGVVRYGSSAVGARRGWTRRRSASRPWSSWRPTGRTTSPVRCARSSTHSPDGTQLVVVANAPSDAQAAALAGLDAVDPGAPGIATEVVWTAARLGWAAALNAGIRRAVAPVVILLDTSVEPAGDLVSALARRARRPDGRGRRSVRARVGRPAHVRGGARRRRRRRRDRGLRAGLPARRLRRPRPARRALRVLPRTSTSGGASCSATRTRTTARGRAAAARGPRRPASR